MTKKIIYLLCILLILQALLPSCGGTKGEGESTNTAPATEQTDFPLYEYDEEGGAAVITSTRLLAVNLEVPSELDGFPVVGIGPSVFSGIREMESAVIPEGVTSIGASAFEGCKELKDVTIPASVSSIGERAFRSTPWFDSLTDEFVTVGDGVLIKYNGDAAEVAIPDNVKYLSDGLSASDNVVSVTVSGSVKHIGSRAFSGMKALTSVSFPESELDIGDSAFTFCLSLEEITVPANVTCIGEFAFSRCAKLEKVVIEAPIEKLPMGFFMSCPNLREVTLPETLKTIELSAFEGCSSLERVNIPASVESISPGAFDEGTPVTAAVAPDSYAETFCKQNGIKYVTK